MRKLIENILHEEMGVPSNIVEAAKLITENIYYELKKIFSGDGYLTEDKYPLSFRINTNISDLTIKKVSFMLEIKEVGVNELTLGGAGFNPRQSIDYNKFVYVSKKDPSDLHIMLKFYIPDDEDVDVTFDDFFTYYEDNFNEVVNNISHEIKHAYDHFKKPEESIPSSVEYQSSIGFGFGINPLIEFFFDVYYSHQTENLVRATEVYTGIKTNNINKEQFLEFLLKTESYQRYKNLSEFTFDNFYNSLFENIDVIKERLKQNQIDIPETDDEIVKLILRLAYTNITNKKIESLRNRLSSGFAEMLMGINPESKKGKFFEKNAGKFAKYENNYIGFYKNEIKKFNNVGNYMVKKISKLYAMANDDDSKQSDIIKKIYNKVNP
jgi:hypothetical protein